MDTDSLPPLLLLLVFLAAFAYFSLAEHSTPGGGGILRESSAGPRPWVAVAPFKHAIIIAIVVIGLLIALSYSVLTWLAVVVTYLAILILLTGIHRLAAVMANRNPALASRAARPLLALFRRGSQPSVLAVVTSPVSVAEQPPADGVQEELDITQEELVSMDRHDREMLRSIIQLDNSTAHEVMVPRLDVVALEINTPIPRAIEPIITSGHTRIPVYEENLDHIVGIIHSLDLLQLLAREDWTEASLRDLLRQPYFIPETKRLDVLLEEFQEKAVQMAIVVDEYGGTEGIITLEDLLEEIVGEIEDEFSWAGEEEVVLEEDGSALINASVTNDVIEEMFGVKLDNPDVDTIGGYVYMNLGRMPHVGDVVETEALTIEISSVLGRRIHKVHIRRKRQAPTPST